MRTAMLLAMLASVAGDMTEQTPCTPPEFVGTIKQFIVEQENGLNRRSVPAYEGTTDASTFYDYYSHSSHTGLEVEGGSVLFLYRDISNPASKLDLFWIHGKEVNTQETSELEGLITGAPAGVTISQSDDTGSPGEFGRTTSNTPGTITGSGPNFAGNWWYRLNTDGGAISNLPLETDWELIITAAGRTGNLHTWQFIFGDGSTPLDLLWDQRVFLRPVTTPVGDPGVQPYPQTVTTNTYCVLAEDTGSATFTYRFMWGDGTPDTVVTKPAGMVACADHTFCGPISGTCGGTFPREVTVSVHGDDNRDCDETKLLAREERRPCQYDVGVKVDGQWVSGTPPMNGGSLDLSQIPAQFSDMTQFIPPTIQENDQVKLKCCGDGDCCFIVSTYHCPPCSGSMNGGYPASLPLEGFVSGSCAPRFGEDNHKMTSFKIKVDANSYVLLPPAAVYAPYVVIYGKKGDCDDWCPTKGKNNCGGPCPPSNCLCTLNNGVKMIREIIDSDK